MISKDSLGFACQHGQLARACYVCELEAELAEQCRINAMGAERELSALNRVRELEAVARVALEALEHADLYESEMLMGHHDSITAAIESLRKTLVEA